jgi:hypothetical protein
MFLTRTAPLRLTSQPGGILKRLKGVVPVEVSVRRRELASVADPEKAAGKESGGAVRLTVERFQHAGGQVMAMVSVAADREWSYDVGRSEFEVSDARGRSFSTGRVRLVPSAAPGGGRLARVREPVALFGAAPGAGFPAALPWPALAGAARRPLPRVWKGTVQFFLPPDAGPLTRLALYGFDRARVDLPFEFRDLPLP